MSGACKSSCKSGEYKYKRTQEYKYICPPDAGATKDIRIDFVVGRAHRDPKENH